MIKNLIFDFGKVLVDYDFLDFFAKIIPDKERCSAFGALLNTVHFANIIDREERPFEETMEDFISPHQEIEKEIRVFMEHYPEIVKCEMPGMRDLLTRLKAEGFKLYGLTNWCSKVHLTMQQFEIFRLLDGQVISSEEHVIKPEPEIYKILFERFGLKPEECVLTDDRAENIAGGRAMGMEGIVFENAEQYERELRTIIASAL